MTEIAPFQFPATGQQVRTVLVDGEPWFVAKDVTDVLGYSNGRMAVGSLPERMRDSVTIPDGNRGNPNRTVISEPGVYRLVMRSDLLSAEAFQDWIAEEVVPAIRRTGGYSVTTVTRLPDITTPAGVLAMAEQFTETARQLVAADVRIRELEPKALAHDRYLTADKGDRLVRQVAKLIGWKEKDLRAFLLDEKLIFRKQALCGAYEYDAYATHAKHFKPVEKIVEHTWGACSHYTLYVRPAGVDLIQRRIERQRASISGSIQAGA